MTTGDFDPQPGQQGEAEVAPPEPAEPVEPAATHEPGSLGLRLGARVIDNIIVYIVVLVLVFLLTFVLDYERNTFLFTLINGIIAGVLNFVYFVVQEVKQGTTVGKRVLGLSVHGPDGGKPTVQQSATRNAWVLLTIIPPQVVGGVLYLIAVIAIAVTINGSPTKQGIHDRLAGGTQVVKG
jgi:uncharacterized RDD family membrane protein YckC